MSLDALMIFNFHVPVQSDMRWSWGCYWLYDMLMFELYWLRFLSPSKHQTLHKTLPSFTTVIDPLTHDEKFMSAAACMDQCENYWKIFAMNLTNKTSSGGWRLPNVQRVHVVIFWASSLPFRGDSIYSSAIYQIFRNLMISCSRYFYYSHLITIWSWVVTLIATVTCFRFLLEYQNFSKSTIFLKIAIFNILKSCRNLNL